MTRNNVRDYIFIPLSVFIIEVICAYFLGGVIRGYIQTKIQEEEKKQITYEQVSYEYLDENFKWLDPELYKYIKKYSKKRNVSMILLGSIIQVESRGRNIISKKNRNGTRDYGYMQINSCHVKNNPKQLLELDLNIKIGSRYIKKCLLKSEYNLKESIRMYNAGLNSKRENYKNWTYVNNINNKFKKSSKKGEPLYACFF